ncbi:MAG: DNA-directed RNA polymerase subunit omega [Planctomycetota bacterium]
MKTSNISLASEKAGGSFRLTALLQKRVVELMRGAPPLIDNPDRRDLIKTALQEILEDKIELAIDDEEDEEGEE